MIATHVVGEVWCALFDGEIAVSERGEVFSLASRVSKGATIAARHGGPQIEVSSDALLQVELLRERLASSFIA